MNQTRKEKDWRIHVAKNGCVCQCGCGKIIDDLLPGACNARTVGMEKYNHLDFQFVLDVPVEVIGWILNNMCYRVQAGEVFHAGDMVDGLFQDYDVRLDEFMEDNITMLRVIIPDDNHLFPEDEQCMDLYKIQSLQTKDLYIQEYQ